MGSSPPSTWRAISLDFDLTEEQSMLRSLVQRFVADRCGADRQREARSKDEGFCSDSWAALAETGLVAAPLPVAAGGMELGPVDLIVIFQELGRGLAGSPLAESVIGAGTIFSLGADIDILSQWKEPIAAGTRRLALAHTERAARYNLSRVDTRAAASGPALRLNGQKMAVAHAVGADGFIVSAVNDAGHVELFLVVADSAGVALTPYRQIDGSVAAIMELNDVAPLAKIAGGMAAICEAATRLSLVRSAEAVGIMDMLLESTIDHIRHRHQFGQPIGSFQAIQHRMAAQYVALEQARSLLYWAAMQDRLDGEQWARSLAGARSFIVDAAISLGHEAIQLHGGMGVTDELAIGHAHKRLVQIANGSEPPDLSLDRYAGLAH